MAACAIGPEPEAEAEPEPGSSDSGDASVASDDSADDDDGDGDNLTTGFVPDYDIPPDPDACDPMHPECDPGEKCSLVRPENDSDFIGRCVPIADETVVIGERCVSLGEPGHDNCEDGSVCWDIMNGEGTCLGFCQGSADDPMCEDSYVCNWGKSWVAGLCTPICDPLSTADCPETCGCYWSNSDFFCLPRTSDIATGEPCGFINDCAPLNLCATAEVVPDCAGSACCAAYCDLAVPSCGPDTSGLPFFEEGTAPPLYEDIGICIIPESED
jgi:hypothetical protein